MAHRTDTPTDPPADPTAFPTGAQGSAASTDSHIVDLVWRDPETGEELTLGLDASPELIDGLRRDGFMVITPAPLDGGSGSSAAA